MITKLHFLDWEPTPTAFENLTKNIIQDEYSEEIGFGFIIQSATNTQIIGRYIIKQKMEVTVTTPLGTEEAFERLHYDITEFEIYPKRCGIVLLNPPRSVRTFISQISKHTKEPIKIENITIDTVILSEEITKHFDSTQILSMQINNININKSKISILANGDFETLELIKTRLNIENYSIDRLEISCKKDDDISLKIKMTSKCTIQTHRELTVQDKEMLYDSVQKAHKKHTKINL